MAKRRYSETITQYLDLQAAIETSEEEEEDGLEDEGELGCTDGLRQCELM